MFRALEKKIGVVMPIHTIPTTIIINQNLKIKIKSRSFSPPDFLRITDVLEGTVSVGS